GIGSRWKTAPPIPAADRTHGIAAGFRHFYYRMDFKNISI
ncbi:hypothetical protein HMPREF1548_03100, partial [Clostridium sp. KLE 1755]